MIKKETIKKTAVTYFSQESDCFVAESPLLDRVIGTGETADEALTVFEEMLEDFFPHLKSGNVIGYNRVGRPAKPGLVQLSCKPKAETQAFVNQLAGELDLSQGEVIDYLCFWYQKRSLNQHEDATSQPTLEHIRAEVRKEVKREMRKLQASRVSKSAGMRGSRKKA
jgi:predicted RNase H-like HicB family nuclease